MASVHVEYDDGSEADIRITPRGLVAAERKWSKDMPKIEGGLFAAWNCAGKPGVGFEPWLESITDFSMADPTKASPTLSDESPDSQSSQG